VIGLDILIGILVAASLVVVLISLRGVRRSLDNLRDRRLPFGWKYLEHEGPPLGFPPSAQWSQRLGLQPEGHDLLLYIFACSQCTFLYDSLPALLDDFRELRAIVLTENLLGIRQRHCERLHYLEDKALVDEWKFHTAPYAVYFEAGVPIRKGIVNSLEQLRLTVDPAGVQRDMKLA
jgi:hypothetical protein